MDEVTEGLRPWKLVGLTVERTGDMLPPESKSASTIMTVSAKGLSVG